MDEVASGNSGCARRGGAWHVTGGGGKFHSVGNAFSGGGCDEHAIAAIMFWSMAQIPPVLAVYGPRASFFWRFVHNDASAQGREWRAVEVESAIEVGL
jgi:hypothetical protein